jgi:hypothetical protein
MFRLAIAASKSYLHRHKLRLGRSLALFLTDQPMKKLLFCLLVLTATLRADTVDLSKPVPRLRLEDGRILQDVTFAQFKAYDIFLRHKGGSAVVRYEALPDEIRAAAEQKRPGGPKWFPGETAEKATTLEGQVFVQTRGAGPYKFGDVKVYAFDAKHLKAWEGTYLMEVQLPKPLSVATTDGDGRFKLTVPKDQPFFVYCHTSRAVGQYTEENEWRVPGETFKNAKEAVLSNANVGKPTKKVLIEETP